MTWVALRKRLYVPGYILVLGGVVLGLWWAQAGWPAYVASALLLSLPGIIARRLLRDLFDSRARLARGDYEGALVAARAFEANLQKRPWIRHVIWAQYGVYTLDVLAMAINNQGAALLELDRRDEARLAFERATARDPHYPIPVFNLALIAALDGDEASSRRLAADAAQKGYAGGRLDRALELLGAQYARFSAPRPG